MMKKLLAVLLSVMMTASLAAPAFAAPGLSPEEAASIGVIGGADGPTAIITSGPVNGTIDLGGIDLDSFVQEHPDVEGLLDWDSLEEELQQARNENKKALGGVPGQVGVMVDGKYVQFPDAAPEVVDGATMAPVRALVEAMGGEVEVDGDKVACTAGDVTVTFEMNGFDVEVERRNPDGSGEPKTEWVTMPVAAALKGGRTYVPVRFLAGTLGYDVGWDAYYETVILLDREALAAEIDKDFTILNKVQANKSVGMEEGKNYRADVKGNVAVTLFDTLNGSKTYQADLAAKQLFNTGAASAQISLKLSENALEELDKWMTSQFGAGYEEDAAMVRTVAEGLEDMEFILTKEGPAWFRMAALDELAGEDNVWLAMDLGNQWGELAFAQAGDTTVGKALARLMPCESVTEWDSVMEMVDMLNALYGDEKFTTSGGTSTLTIDLDSLMALYEDMGMSGGDIETAKAAFQEYKITMKVDGKGASTVACVMETAAQAGVPGMKITMDVKQAAGNVTMTMSYHIANMGEVKLELTETQQTTSGKPVTEPPAGATIVDNGAGLLNP